MTEGSASGTPELPVPGGDRTPQLRPADDNPWYRLATLWGPGAEHLEANRQAWNRLTAARTTVGADDERLYEQRSRGEAVTSLTDLLLQPRIDLSQIGRAHV